MLYGSNTWILRRQKANKSLVQSVLLYDADTYTLRRHKENKLIARAGRRKLETRKLEKLSTLLDLTERNANHIIPSCCILPVSCRSLIDRCGSLGS